MMTPKDLLDTMLGYLGFVVDIEETTNEGGNATLQIYTEESRRLVGRNGETLEAIQFLLNRLLQAKDKDAEKVIVDCEHYRSMREDRIVQRVRELADRVRAPRNAQGLFVQDVDPDGRAADAGIRAGDIIQEANRQPVKTVDDLRSAARHSSDKPLLLLVNREGRDIFVTVKPVSG